jgi:hypothetical protein
MRPVYSTLAWANSLDWLGDMMILLDEFQQSTSFERNVAHGRDREKESEIEVKKEKRGMYDKAIRFSGRA